MENLKVGQKVRIKSKEWYEACKYLGFKLQEDKTIFDVCHTGQIGHIEQVFGNLVMVKFNDGSSNFFKKGWLEPIENQVTIQKDMETNKLVLNGITLPKDTEVKVSVDEGTTIITFQKQESDGNKFKKGDVIYIEGIYDYHDLAIVESSEENYILVSGYIDLNANKTYICLNNDYDFYSKRNIKSARLATKEEIYKLNKLFAEQKHLQWNAEELKFEKYRWRAECGDRYWHITELGTVIYSSDYHSPYDNILYNLRNYFQTEELAKQALPKLEDFFKNLNK